MNFKAKSFLVTLFLFVLITCGGVKTVSAAPDDDDHRRPALTVDDDHAQCPNAAYSRIQDAINAARPGDRINVCPGTYHEQLKVTKPLTIQGIEVANQNLATIMPAPAVANSTSLTTSSPIAAVVLVDGTQEVNLSNLTVDGATNGINGCGPDLIGIYYRNASGVIANVAVKNMKLGTGLEGCQSGLGIFVQSGGGKKSKVDVLASSVHDYQKNGITGNEVGTEINVIGNAVTGNGPTPFIAQNGIQIADGAKGSVVNNSVINHIYSLCTSLSNCGASSTNILIFDSDDVRVANNNSGNSQLGVYYQGNRGDVENNTIYQTRVFEGIDLVGDKNEAEANSISNSDDAAVYVLGSKNSVTGNTINETPIGIFEDTGSSNNHFDGNHFFNTGMNTQPPSSAMSSLQALTNTTTGRVTSVARP